MASLAVEGSSSLPPEKRAKIESYKSVSQLEEDHGYYGGTSLKKHVTEFEEDMKHSCVCGSYEGSSDEEISPENCKEYARQLKENEYFEVDDFRHLKIPNNVVPLPVNDYRRNLCTPYAKKAIEMFNKEEGKNFEFKELVNITARFISCIDYYLTFKAKDAAETEPRTFQAMVISWVGDREEDVVLCRLKPTKKPGEPGRLEPTVDEICHLRQLKDNIFFLGFEKRS